MPVPMPLPTPARSLAEQVRLASWLRRVGASLIDLALLYAFVTLAGLPVIVGLTGGDRSDGAAVVSFLLVYLVAGLALGLVQLRQEGATGATVGKALLGVRVVSDRDGLPLGFGRAALRRLAHGVDLLGILVPFGLLAPLFDRSNRTFADCIMHSVAVRSPDRARPPLRQLVTSPILVGALLAGVLGGGLLALGADDGDPAAPVAGSATTARASASPRPAAPSPAASTKPTAPPAALDPDDLEGRLLKPDGYTQLSDTLTELGDLTLDEAVKLESATEAEAEDVRALLRLLGYQRGRAHSFGGDGEQLTLVVYRLAGAAGVQQLAAPDRTAEGAFTSRTVPGADTTVAQVPDVGSVQVGLLGRGRFFYEVVLVTDEPVPHDSFDAVLEQVRDRAVRSDP